MMRGGKSHQAKPDLKSYPVLGKHSFTPTKPDMTLMPTFEINHKKIILTKARFFPSPLNSKRNVDWLQLNTIQGNFASRVYRTYTRGGKVPAPQCNTVNQIIKEPYAAIVSFRGLFLAILYPNTESADSSVVFLSQYSFWA
jgi:hypothetical protein